MDRLYATVSRMMESQSRHLVQDAGLFVVEFSMNPGMSVSMDCFQSDTGKVPPNRWYP